MKFGHKTTAVSALLFSLALAAMPVAAAEIIEPDKQSGSVSVARETPIKNLYTAGGIVNISTEIENGLYTAGGSVVIDKRVGQNLMAAGGTVISRGEVGGSAHFAGGNVMVEGSVADDLFIGGGNINISSTAAIGGDLIIGGGNVVINAPVQGNILVGGGQVTINGKVAGSVKARVEKLTLGEQAEIAGDLDYTAAQEATMAAGAVVIGEKTYKQATMRAGSSWKHPGGGRFFNIDKKTVFGFMLSLFLAKFMVMLATALALAYLLRKVFEPAAKTGLANFWPSAGIGFLALIAAPPALILIAATVIGIGLAFLAGLSYALLFLLATALANIICGRWLMKLIQKKDGAKIWQEVLLGTAALSIVGIIPMIGWGIVLVFVLAALGALLRLTYEALLKRS